MLIIACPHLLEHVHVHIQNLLSFVTFAPDLENIFRFVFKNVDCMSDN